MTDHYSTLGVGKDASAADIKKAYRKRASKSHPDKGGNAEEFKVAKAAYECLSDPVRRLNYDETGTDAPGKTPEQLAEETLAQLFAQAIEARANENPVVIVSNALVNHINEMKARKKQITAAFGHLKKQRGRVKAKAGANLFQAVIDKRVKQAEADLAKAERDIAHHILVQKALANYESTDPPAPKPQPFGGVQFRQGGDHFDTFSTLFVGFQR